jgi:type I restriction enzyme S subunit
MARAMKDSGIEWIGDIPEEWEVRHLKTILAERKENNNPIKTDFILSLTVDRGVIPYSEKAGGGNKAKEDLTAYKLAYPNDIVLNSMNVLAGSVGISKYFGCVSPVYYMLYPRNTGHSVEYFNDIFQTKEFQGSLLGYGNGIMMKESSTGKLNTIRMRIPMSKLNTVQLPVPSIEEQQCIADYLGKKCKEIDSIIENTKATIEEYKKYKQSVITEAVTKGLEPIVKMKDSGIEWIGEIPKHWEIRKFKNIATLGSGGTPTSSNREFYENGYINWVCSLDLHEAEIYNTEQKLTKLGFDNCAGSIRPINTIAIAMYGGGGTIGNSGILKVESASNQAICCLIFNKKICNEKYMFYYIRTIRKYWMIYAVGTRKDPNINQNIVANMTVLLPHIDVQQKIVNYLDNRCAEIDTLVSKKQQIIIELESYKKSLIYECVTGKLEV